MSQASEARKGQNQHVSFAPSSMHAVGTEVRRRRGEGSIGSSRFQDPDAFGVQSSLRFLGLKKLLSQVSHAKARDGGVRRQNSYPKPWLHDQNRSPRDWKCSSQRYPQAPQPDPEPSFLTRAWPVPEESFDPSFKG